MKVHELGNHVNHAIDVWLIKLIVTNSNNKSHPVINSSLLPVKTYSHSI